MILSIPLGATDITGTQDYRTRLTLNHPCKEYTEEKSSDEIDYEEIQELKSLINRLNQLLLSE